MDQRIKFFLEGTELKLRGKNSLRTWISALIREEKKKLTSLNFIFCDDNYLLNLNEIYLQHDHYTDVIAFSYSQKEKHIDGDIYISVDRVKENAITYEAILNIEFLRVMAHGILHLAGYKDADEKDRTKMKIKEDYYLKKRILNNKLIRFQV